MKMYAVSPKDLKEKHIKCGSCLWSTARLYVLAKTKEEAIEAVKKEHAGLCGDCMCTLIMQEKMEIK